MTLLQFSQNLMQGGWIQKDPFTQLPGIGEDECKKIKQLIGNKTLFQYCVMPVEERKKMAPQIFGDKDVDQKFDE